MLCGPDCLWCPQSQGNRGARAEYADWGQGRSPQALYALMRKGLVFKKAYAFFQITAEGRAICKTDSGILRQAAELLKMKGRSGIELIDKLNPDRQ